MDFLPANIELSGLEVTLVNTMSRETVVREYVNIVRDQYDVILLDCCPSQGNPYLKSMLCEIGWVISGKRTLYLSGWYWRIEQRKGAKRATIALARKLLTLIYTMLKTKEPYNEDCFEQRRKSCERKRAHRMVNELQKLGYMVVPPS